MPDGRDLGKDLGRQVGDNSSGRMLILSVQESTEGCLRKEPIWNLVREEL